MAETGLRWLFFGCGAVGGYYGARLAERLDRNDRETPVWGAESAEAR